MRPAIIGIAGWKNSGKTTLVERLVAELTGRGHAVATLKHAHHDFDVDREGTDSFRHRAAGARETAIVSGRRWAIMHELQGGSEPAFEAMLARLSPCDIVLVEGYKRETHPKIECRRLEAADRAPLAGTSPNVIAIAADHGVEDAEVPVFALDDVAAIADFVEAFAKASMTGRS